MLDFSFGDVFVSLGDFGLVWFFLCFCVLFVLGGSRIRVFVLGFVVLRGV